MTRTELCRKINDLMTAEGCSLSEDQDAVLAAALGALWDEITGAGQEPAAWRYKKEGGGWFVSDNEPKYVEQWNDIEEIQPLYTKEPK